MKNQQFCFPDKPSYCKKSVTTEQEIMETIETIQVELNRIGVKVKPLVSTPISIEEHPTYSSNNSSNSSNSTINKTTKTTKTRLKSKFDRRYAKYKLDQKLLAEKNMVKTLNLTECTGVDSITPAEEVMILSVSVTLMMLLLFILYKLHMKQVRERFGNFQRPF